MTMMMKVCMLLVLFSVDVLMEAPLHLNMLLILSVLHTHAYLNSLPVCTQQLPAAPSSSQQDWSHCCFLFCLVISLKNINTLVNVNDLI